MKEFWQRVDAVGRWIAAKLTRKHRTTADIKMSIYIKKAWLIQLAAMSWFVSLSNDPSSIYAFDVLQWVVVAGCTWVLMWLAGLNAKLAFLANPDQPDKTNNPEEPPSQPAEPAGK